MTLWPRPKLLTSEQTKRSSQELIYDSSTTGMYVLFVTTILYGSNIFGSNRNPSRKVDQDARTGAKSHKAECLQLLLGSPLRMDRYFLGVDQS